MALYPLVLAVAVFTPLNPTLRTFHVTPRPVCLCRQRAPPAFLSASSGSNVDGSVRGMGRYSTEVGSWPGSPQSQKHPETVRVRSHTENDARSKEDCFKKNGAGRKCSRDGGSKALTRDVHRQKMDRHRERIRNDRSQILPVRVYECWDPRAVHCRANILRCRLTVTLIPLALEPH